MGVLFEVLDDLLADHFTLKATQCGLDGLVSVYMNRSHFFLTSFRPRILPLGQTNIKAGGRPNGKVNEIVSVDAAAA